MIQLKLTIFVEMLAIMTCGIIRIFMPFPFIKTTLIVIVIMAMIMLLVFVLAPVLEWWLK